MRAHVRGVRGVLTAALAITATVSVTACAGVTAAPAPSSGTVNVTIGDRDPELVQHPTRPVLPVTVDSVDEARVTVGSADRIVAVDRNGTLGQTVFALGLGDRLVARDLATNFPSVRQLPVVTPGGHQVNAEAILALRPTVVLTDASIGPRTAMQQLRDSGIPVVNFSADRTLDEVDDLILAVANALGVPESGRQLAQRSVEQINTAKEGATQHARGERVAFLYLRGNSVAMIGGPGAGSDDLIEAVGAVDAGVQAGLTRPFTPITAEALIAAQPEVLLLMTKGLESVGGIDGLLRIPGVAATPAGKNRRVVTMVDSELLSFGPDTGKVVAALDDGLHGGSR